ncbi:MAG TPA: DUF885 domain-containing protein [Gemmatimonadales bacterium]|nr:DUF885 domain-containing protein [Gemmatimonadales bacterium]
MLRSSGLSTMLVAAGLLAACQGRAEKAGGDWNRFASGFIETYFKANPLFASYQGRHEYDGLFPDWSEAGLQRWMGRLHQLRDSAAAFPIDSSNASARFERDYLIAVIDRDLFWGERADLPHRNPEFYTAWLDPNVYLAREYAPLPERMRAFTRYATNLPAALALARSNLGSPMPKAYAKIGQGRMAGLAEYLEGSVPAVFASVGDTTLQREFATANAAAAKAFRELSAWFGQQEKQGTDDFALGPERFSEMLRMTEGVDLPLDSLERRGREDMDRNLAALKEACGRYAPGQSIQKCVDRMNAHKAPGSPVQAAAHQLDTLEAFVRAKNLVSVPGTEGALVREAPPYQRFNFAYIDIPGPYEKNLPSIYYIAPPDPTWPKAEQEAYVPGAADLLFTSVHEVWPGHFLNFLHSNRAQSKFGQIFVGYAFAEGWAHYTEEMMWEAGLGNGDPETHIGQLMNALLRNARYLSAIGMHTKGMTLAESERLFREQAYQDPGNARQQAARGSYDPAYLNYTLGKLMIRKLREDWTSTRGGREAWHDFHDQFLSYGGPPIPLVRRAMVGAGPAL